MSQGQITNRNMTSDPKVEVDHTLCKGWTFLSARKFAGVNALELHFENGNQPDREVVTLVNLDVGDSPMGKRYVGSFRMDSGDMRHIYQVINS